MDRIRDRLPGEQRCERGGGLGVGGEGGEQGGGERLLKGGKAAAGQLAAKAFERAVDAFLRGGGPDAKGPGDLGDLERTVEAKQQDVPVVGRQGGEGGVEGGLEVLRWAICGEGWGFHGGLELVDLPCLTVCLLQESARGMDRREREPAGKRRVVGEAAGFAGEEGEDELRSIGGDAGVSRSPEGGPMHEMGVAADEGFEGGLVPLVGPGEEEVGIGAVGDHRGLKRYGATGGGSGQFSHSAGGFLEAGC